MLASFSYDYDIKHTCILYKIAPRACHICSSPFHVFVIGPMECRLLPEYILSTYHAHFTYNSMEIMLYVDPCTLHCGVSYTGTMNNIIFLLSWASCPIF